MAKSYALTAPGLPVFDDLRRCSGAEWKRGPVERFTGRRWNGAEWNRLELAKSGPKRADVSLEAASGDSSAVEGWRKTRFLLGWRLFCYVVAATIEGQQLSKCGEH